jgi:hypothetical protein
MSIFCDEPRGTMMAAYRLFFSTLLVFSTWVSASNLPATSDEAPVDVAPISLSELAAKADLVAVVQVKDTDYVYTRSFPSEGVAILDILIQYKINQPQEKFIEVYEKGLHPNECYFEDPAYSAEGRRYLVFFRVDPQDPEYYLGLEEGCALEIFVTQDNQYALKYPVDGIRLTDKLDELLTFFTFRDNHALVSEDSISPSQRDDLLERGMITPYQDQFKYTHGIDLSAARRLINTGSFKKTSTQ